MLKKYWWLIIVLVIVVAYVAYKWMQNTASMNYGVVPTTSSEPIIQTSGVPSLSNNIYTTKTDPTKGSYLADFQGMSLYVFDNDLASGKSTCYDTCAAKWLAYTSGAAAETTLPANITVMTRTDGSTQFAWKGRPLYYYSLDQQAGDIFGDGFDGIWHLVKP